MVNQQPAIHYQIIIEKKKYPPTDLNIPLLSENDNDVREQGET